MKDAGKIESLNDMWAFFALTSEALHAVTKDDLRKYRITPIQVGVVFWINVLGDKATAPEIARCVFRERHSMSELLLRMERAGLVKRIRDLRKKNTIRYELTEKGFELHRKSSKRLKMITRIFASLSQEQKQQLKSILFILFGKAIKELKVKYNMPLPFDL